MAGKGGVNPGSGRKPKLLTELLLSIPQAEKNIRTAFALFVATMSDEKYPIDTRLDAAREVLNRLCGKPAQAVILAGDDERDPVTVALAGADPKRAALDLLAWRKQMCDQLAAETGGSGPGESPPPPLPPSPCPRPPSATST